MTPEPDRRGDVESTPHPVVQSGCTGDAAQVSDRARTDGTGRAGVARASVVARQVRRLGWVLVAVTLVAVLGWSTGVWSFLTGASAPAAPTGSSAGGAGLDIQPGVDRYPASSRAKAPEFAGTTLDDKSFALSDLAGDIVVVNVWGSWCAPCRIETPDLVRVANAYADRGVSFVGINIRDDRAAANEFVRAFNVPYPSVEDPDGKVLLSMRGALPASVVPTTLVIDRQGAIAARIIGRATYETMTGILDAEVGTPTGRR